ncbi:MAG: hypothetical protein KAS32_21325, partial [Candidatus Peribacteraceae bacterium]|nr:hypothetical protein [Candidatus Peribacteraceae bacterium]
SKMEAAIVSSNTSKLVLDITLESSLTNITLEVPHNPNIQFSDINGIKSRTIRIEIPNRQTGTSPTQVLRLLNGDAPNQELQTINVNYDERNGNSSIGQNTMNWNNIQANNERVPSIPTSSILQTQGPNIILSVNPPSTGGGRVQIREGAILGKQNLTGNEAQVATLTINSDAKTGTYHIDCVDENGVIHHTITFNWNAQTKEITYEDSATWSPEKTLKSAQVALNNLSTDNITNDIANAIAAEVLTLEMEQVTAKECEAFASQALHISDANIRLQYRGALWEKSNLKEDRDTYVSQRMAEHPQIFPEDWNAFVESILQPGDSRGSLEETLRRTQQDYKDAFHQEYHKRQERITNILMHAEQLVLSLRNGTYTRGMVEEFRNVVEADYNKDLNLGNFVAVIQEVNRITSSESFRDYSDRAQAAQDYINKEADRNMTEHLAKREERIKTEQLANAKIDEYIRMHGVTVTVAEGRANAKNLLSLAEIRANMGIETNVNERLQTRIEYAMLNSQDPRLISIRDTLGIT